MSRYMRVKQVITGILICSSPAILVNVLFGQASDLKPAMARIRDINNQGGGSGFVFRHDIKEHVVYLLTNEHVVRGAKKVNVQFFLGTGKPVTGVVIRQDKAKDLAIVTVSGDSNIPAGVMIIALGQASA